MDGSLVNIDKIDEKMSGFQLLSIKCVLIIKNDSHCISGHFHTNFSINIPLNVHLIDEKDVQKKIMASAIHYLWKLNILKIEWNFIMSQSNQIKYTKS